MAKHPPNSGNKDHLGNDPHDYRPGLEGIRQSINNLPAKIDGIQKENKAAKIEKRKSETTKDKRVRQIRKNVGIYSVVISAILAFVTGGLYIAASHQNGLAEKQFGRDTTALQYQIDEFKALNEPLLQIDLDSLKVLLTLSSPISIYYVVRNLRPANAKITYVLTQGVTSTAPIDMDSTKVRFDSIEKSGKFKKSMDYLTKDNPFHRKVSVSGILTQPLGDSLKMKQTFIYFFGKMRYTNSITKKDNIYWFEIKISLNNNWSFYREFYYNENFDETGQER
jgi:hypothetical protein